MRINLVDSEGLFPGFPNTAQICARDYGADEFAHSDHGDDADLHDEASGEQDELPEEQS